jgi:hypothetical protein
MLLDVPVKERTAALDANFGAVTAEFAILSVTT